MEDAQISRTDNIQDTVIKYPETIDVFMSYGLHCIGCHVSASENIEQGCYGHGMDDETILSLITDLNETVREKGEVFDLKITQKGVNAISLLMSEEGKAGYDLRIIVTKKDDDFSYDFEFEQHKRKADDHEFYFYGLHVIVDKDSFLLLQGTKIDFISNDFEQGFKIQNPHADVSPSGCSPY